MSSTDRIAVPTYLQFPPTAPINLDEVLIAQANCLMQINAAAEAKVRPGLYEGQLRAAINRFDWSKQLVAIGLDHVAVVDYRLRDAFLAEVGGIELDVNLDECYNFQGVLTPEGIHVVQVQWGRKFNNKAPRDCRKVFADTEEGGIIKEGFHAFVYEGKGILEGCGMDFAGSSYENGYVPCLDLTEGHPWLHAFKDGESHPDYGSVSRGKVPLRA